jgi:hypothetical protein
MLEILGLAYAQSLDFESEHASGVLGGAVAQRHAEVGCIPQHGDVGDRRERIAHDLEALGTELGRQFRDAGDIAARPRDPVDQAGRHRIAGAGDDDRYVFGRRLGGERRGIAERDDDIEVGGFELGHQTLEPLEARIGRSLHHDEVLAVDESTRGETGEKGLAALVEQTHRGSRAKQPQAIGFAGLLCARAERPRRGGGNQ